MESASLTHYTGAETPLCPVNPLESDSDTNILRQLEWVYSWNECGPKCINWDSPDESRSSEWLCAPSFTKVKDILYFKCLSCNYYIFYTSLNPNLTSETYPKIDEIWYACQVKIKKVFWYVNDSSSCSIAPPTGRKKLKPDNKNAYVLYKHTRNVGPKSTFLVCYI